MGSGNAGGAIAQNGVNFATFWSKLTLKQRDREVVILFAAVYFLSSKRPYSLILEFYRSLLSSRLAIIYFFTEIICVQDILELERVCLLRERGNVMEIAQPTPTQLIVRERSLAPALFNGAIVALLGLILCLSFQVRSLTCHRDRVNRGSCKLTVSDVFVTRTDTVPLARLHGAKFERGDRNPRVLLVTSDGDKVLYSGSKFDRYDPVAIADRINTFLDASESTSLNLRYDDRWLSYSLGGLLMVIGLIQAMSHHDTICRFDKTLGRATLKRRSALGTRCWDFPLTGVAGGHLETDGSDREGIGTLNLMLADGRQIPIAKLERDDLAEAELAIESMNQFLRREERRSLPTPKQRRSNRRHFAARGLS